MQKIHKHYKEIIELLGLLLFECRDHDLEDLGYFPIELDKWRLKLINEDSYIINRFAEKYYKISLYYRDSKGAPKQISEKYWNRIKDKEIEF